MNVFEKCGFVPSEIYLPKKGTDMTKWAVIACDQYTSDRSYWEDVDKFVGDAPSTLRLIVPETYLSESGVESRISSVNETMEKYLSEGVLEPHAPCYVYVERTLPDGSVRRGIVGAIDLELYDYSRESKSRVRATEQTIVERIPPRLAVRKNAPLEFPHIMILIDDVKERVIASLAEKKGSFVKLYDFDLMKGAGHICGYAVPEDEAEAVAEKLCALADEDNFKKKYGVCDKGVMQYAMGDGNHSLATAKAYYESAGGARARYALCELVSLHDESLFFEAIHRTVFDTDTKRLTEAFFAAYPNGKKAASAKRGVDIYVKGEKTTFVPNEPGKTEVAVLQNFLDAYLSENDGRIDYIHGEKEAVELSMRDNAVSFILPAMDKSELFKAILNGGSLPRKTFSMGSADTKRFYNEARKIK